MQVLIKENSAYIHNNGFLLKYDEAELERDEKQPAYKTHHKKIHDGDMTHIIDFASKCRKNTMGILKGEVNVLKLLFSQRKFRGS